MEMEMEMDRICPMERRQLQKNLQNCTNLDIRTQKNTGQATNDLVKECRERAEKDGVTVMGPQQRLLECRVFLNGLSFPVGHEEGREFESPELREVCFQN